MICCRMAVKKDGNIGSECEEDEGIDCENGASDTGKGGWNLTCFV